MNTDIARQNMVAQQVRVSNVSSDGVLAALTDLSRHRFMPDQYAHLAYADSEIPIGHGQLTMTPMLEGKLLQAVALTKDESVLEIGTGCGYLTACLARLAGKVSSIDIYQDFTDNAADNLAAAGIDNAECLCMDAMTELPPGPFDAIVVTGSIARPDSRLLEPLRPGGRMFVIVGEAPVMSAQLVTRGEGAEWNSSSLFETQVAELVNSTGIPRFSL